MYKNKKKEELRRFNMTGALRFLKKKKKGRVKKDWHKPYYAKNKFEFYIKGKRMTLLEE